MILLLLATTVNVALAGIPILHEEPEASKVAADVAEVAGLDPASFESVLATGLLGRPPTILGPATLTPCPTTGTTLAAVRQAYSQAEGAYLYMRDAEARAALDSAVERLGCLADTADPDLAARVFFLLALVHVNEGDEARAVGAFRQALVFAPELVWDSRFPDAGRPIYEREKRAALRDATLRIVPVGTGAGPWIDGRLVGNTPVAVAPGRHLAQLASPDGVQTAWVDVPAATNNVLVLPSAYDKPVLARMDTAEGQEHIEALVQVALPGLRALYVYRGGDIWLVTAQPDGSLETTPVRVAEPAPADPPPAAPGGVSPTLGPQPLPATATDAVTARKGSRVPLLVGGGALAVGGGALAVASWSAGRALVDETCGDSDPCRADSDVYRDAHARYRTHQALLVVGEVGVLAGVGVFGAGVLSATPLTLPGGAGALLTVRP